MSGSVNRAILIGNLGADPEIRHTADGRKIANLRIATSESWRDKETGEKRERVEWHRIVIFSDGIAKIAEQYARKGTKVYVAGQIQTRKWQDKEGQDRWTTEIVVQGFHGEFQLLGGKQAEGESEVYAEPPAKAKSGREMVDDEIPF